ncbi:MAG: YkgJ family cysteine cluster protein [Bdellovibrionota bacterium]
MSLDPVSSTSVSFERIMSWFGTFTPQLKFKLMALRREATTEQFEYAMRESMFVFRSVLHDLSKQPKGAERAAFAHAYLDAEYAARPVTKASCAAGCSACCRSFPKQVTADEADLLARAVNSGRVEIDRAELRRQAGDKTGSAPCVFLSGDGRCKVYDLRPVVCRKYYVTSPQVNCEDKDANVTPHIDLMPELIASASLSLPDNEIGFMAKLLAERIEDDTQAS